MKSLYILVMMQLKEQMNFRRWKRGNLKFFNTLLAVVVAIVKFAAVTALCLAFLLVAKHLGLFSFADFPIPDTVISIVFSVMMLFSTISCTAGLTKSMYYARDNAVLLTLPCTPLQVYLSKLIIFFIFEINLIVILILCEMHMKNSMQALFQCLQLPLHAHGCCSFSATTSFGRWL